MRTILDDVMQLPSSRDWLQLRQLPPVPTLTLLDMQILQAQYRRTLEASQLREITWPREITWREWRQDVCKMVITWWALIFGIAAAFFVFSTLAELTHRLM
jgi:hypothetical protein